MGFKSEIESSNMNDHHPQDVDVVISPPQTFYNKTFSDAKQIHIV